MNGVDFPPGKRYRNRRASRADKNGICQSVLPAQMANDVICATGEGASERAVGMGPLTSISDVSDPYFVRSYHSLLPPIKARECNYTYHREVFLGGLFLPPRPPVTMRIGREWRNGYAT